jgi:putative thiamine transport system ATP-binding protein
MTTVPSLPAKAEGLLVENVCISIAGRRLVELSAHVGPGSVLTVMGPSGSGKSSLLAFMAGFLDPAFKARGRILLNGTSIISLPRHERRLGLMFQDDLLFPHLSVAGNLAFGLRKDVQDRKGVIATALAEVDLADFGERDPETLSGGQRARVALMRTLLSQPKALLLDEPFSKLDRSLRSQIRKFVFGMARARALPVFLVTHDEEDAEEAGGAVLIL